MSSQNASLQRRPARPLYRSILVPSLLFILPTVATAQAPPQASTQEFFGLPSGRNANKPIGTPPEIARNRVKQASHQPSRDITIAQATARNEPCCELCLEPCCLPIITDRFYGRGEMLAWWTDGMDVPPLVTTSPAGTPPNQIGVLGAPGTTVLFGNDGINDGGRLGGRFTLGYRLQPCRPWSIEATYAFLGRESTEFQATSPGTPIIARPFRNIVTGAQDAVQIAIPGELEGNVSIDSSTKFRSFELLARRALARECGVHVDFLIGYRHADLDDRIQIADSITTLVAFPPPLPIIPANTNLSGIDLFETRNRFNGAQLGFACELARCRWSAELLANLALGSTSTEVFIDGSTTITIPPAAPTTQPGNMLALPSNMGRYQQDSFSMIPELTLRLNYDISARWRASIAYTLVYWSHVARAGNQIDLDIDENQLPHPILPPAAGIWPEFRFDFDDFWAQGLSFGLERVF